MTVSTFVVNLLLTLLFSFGFSFLDFSKNILFHNFTYMYEAIIYCFVYLNVVPRVLACTIGVWSPCIKKRDLPKGLWFMLGNMLPENGIYFNNYPIKSSESIENIWFVTSCTIGGIFMSFLHGLAYLFLPFDIVTSTTFNKTYFMPEFKNPEKVFYQSEVQMETTGDSRVWWRTHKSSGGKMYLWIHESHPEMPRDEWMCLLPFKLKFLNYINIIIILLIIVYTLVWTRFLILLLILSEVVWNIVPYKLLYKKFDATF